MKTKIKRNAVRCKLCGDVIESKHRHDYVTCSCGNAAVDGGHDYLRRAYREGIDSLEELSEYEDTDKPTFTLSFTGIGL